MESKRFASVWDAIEDTPHAAASMKARSTLMMELSSYIEGHGLTQAQAADLLGVTQPRVSDLVRGKIDLFSLDTLFDMATSAGMRVGLNIRPVSSVRVRSTATAKKSSSSIMAACPTIGYQKSQ
jgi:predicted XRE-type DNA-binding protein